MKRLYLVCALCLSLSSPLIAQDTPGTITTLVKGLSTSTWPYTVGVDAKDNIYIGDSANVRRLNSDNTTGPVLGGDSSNGIMSLEDGVPAVRSILRSSVQRGRPLSAGIAVDGRGHIYVADPGNNRVRRVDTSGIIWTFAGPTMTGNQFQPAPQGGFSGDGDLATQALLDRPTDVAVDVQGNIYIADSGNGRARMVTPDGFVWTVAGSGRGMESPSGDGGPAANAALVTPYSVAVDVKGNIYIVDFDTHRIRRVSPDRIITTIAGTGKGGFSGDGGPGTQAALSFPRGVAIDGEGNLYIADSGNNRIRRVDRDGIITTFAGTGLLGSSGDGGPATEATLYDPSDVAVDLKGYVYIAFNGSNQIRRVSPLRAYDGVTD